MKTTTTSFFSKKVPKSHISEQRFDPYNKARDFVTHLNNLYELKKDSLAYDESSIMNKVFKSQTPLNSVHKHSLLPKSPIASELERKMQMINIFHTLSERKIKKNINKNKARTPIERKHFDSNLTGKKYNDLLIKLANDHIEKKPTTRDDTFITNKHKYVLSIPAVLTEKHANVSGKRFSHRINSKDIKEEKGKISCAIGKNRINRAIFENQKRFSMGRAGIGYGRNFEDKSICVDESFSKEMAIRNFVSKNYGQYSPKD